MAACSSAIAAFITAPSGVRSRNSTAAATDEVAEFLALHFGRSNEAEKSVDYAILAGEKSQRRWANSEALSYFNDALHRLDLLPDTDANRLRRIDAVLKQGDGQVRARTTRRAGPGPRSNCRSGSPDRRPAAPRHLALLARAGAHHDGRPPEHRDRPL